MAKQHRGRLRLWAGVSLAYCVMTATAYAVCQSYHSDVGRTMSLQNDQVQRQIRQAHLDISSLRQQITNTLESTRISRLLDTVPDWSVVLRLLAKMLGDEVVLLDITLQPPSAPSEGSDATPATPAVILSLHGFARNQPGISQFAIRLEHTNLFSQVAVLETKREPFGDADAISFTMHCTITDGEHAP